MGITNSWKDEYEEKITLEEAKFIFQQAETKLKETTETSQLIVSRTTTVASVSISIMVAIVAYLFSNWDNYYVSYFPLIVIAAIYFFVLNIVIVTNLRPAKYHIAGTSPSQLFIKHFFDTQFDNSRLLEFYKVTIIGYEKSINENKSINQKRWKWFRRSLWMLVLSPVVIIAFYRLWIIVGGS